MSSDVPITHPRYVSLMTRETIVRGMEMGITSPHGLLAHGRGEAFDYLMGEKTHEFAVSAIEAAAAYLLLAERPVISVNGNVSALVPKELIQLGELVGAPLEVNLFHTSAERERRIRDHLLKEGANTVLLPQKETTISHLDSNRKYVNPEGIYRADVVLVPLEDGDRTEALVKNGKNVVTIDLNPSSRTAVTATVTVVDNLVRAMPLLIEHCIAGKKASRASLEGAIERFDNIEMLRSARAAIRRSFV